MNEYTKTIESFFADVQEPGGILSSAGAGADLSVGIDIVEGHDGVTGAGTPDHRQSVVLFVWVHGLEGIRSGEARVSLPVTAEADDEAIDMIFTLHYQRLVSEMDDWLTEHGHPITEASGGWRVATPPMSGHSWAEN